MHTVLLQWPSAGVCLPRRGCLPGGGSVCLGVSAQRGCLPEGCLPSGHLPRGVWLGVYTPLSTDRHVKTLPFLNYCLRTVKIVKHVKENICQAK